MGVIQSAPTAMGYLDDPHSTARRDPRGLGSISVLSGVNATSIIMFARITTAVACGSQQIPNSDWEGTHSNSRGMNALLAREGRHPLYGNTTADR